MTLGVERRYERSVQKRVSEVLVVPADRAFRRLSDDLVVFPFGDLLEPAIAGAKRQKPAGLVRLQAMNRFQESQQLVTQVNPLLLVFAPFAHVWLPLLFVARNAIALEVEPPTPRLYQRIKSFERLGRRH